MNQDAGGDLEGRLAIEGELTIFTAANWKPRLLSALEPGRPVELDLSAVTEIDSAGLQLLILAKREATTRGARLALGNHSPAVVDALELCGLIGFFGDPILVHAHG